MAREEFFASVLQNLTARVRVKEKKNRALADAIAELRGHACLGPELGFYYTLSWL
jgi:hypothetical protein